MTDKPSRKHLADASHVLDRGIEMLASGNGALAAQLADKAVASNPGQSDIEAVARLLHSHKISRFHSSMLRDRARNAAYCAAIERLVPGKRVLDIGTGSGLLAMMAARAGAASVIACEKDPRLAETARQVIAANGLSDKITVLNKLSLDLDRDDDLGGGVDCVVSEVFSEDVVGESVLPTLAHARQELCNPGAIFIPEKASVRIALGDHAVRDDALPDIEGFDLSAFEKHFPPHRHVRAGSGQLALRSDAHTAFEFDFTASNAPPMDARTTTLLESAGGMVNALAQWFRIDFGGGIAYENGPGSPEEISWLIRLTDLAPRECRAGESVSITSWYSTDRLFHWENAASA